MPLDRRSRADRRSSTDRRSGKDRRTGWGRIDAHLLEGAKTTASTVVHEFSRPFTIIIGCVDLILSTTAEEDTRKKLETVKQQLLIIIHILNNFRELDTYETVDFDGTDLLKIIPGEVDNDPSSS
jgi:signal transduction histidine kinase